MCSPLKSMTLSRSLIESKIAQHQAAARPIVHWNDVRSVLSAEHCALPVDVARARRYSSGMTALDDALTSKRDRLLDILRACGRVAVAYSGGVDSAVVAKAAQVACGANAVAVTAVSASLASGEREAAEALAAQIGIRHRVIETRRILEPRLPEERPRSLLLLQDRAVHATRTAPFSNRTPTCPNSTSSSTEPTSTTAATTVRECRRPVSTPFAAR